MQLQKITVIIPAYNEEHGIGRVLTGFPRQALRKAGYKLEIIVIDNSSTDNTAAIARAHGAIVLTEKTKGKGNAMKLGFRNLSADTKYVVMLDADGTYSPKEILRMVEPLESNMCHVVVGSRLSGKMKDGSLKYANRVANWFYTFLVRQFYQENITDVLSGYFAWKKPVVDALLPHLTAGGFSLEMEMITKMHKLGFEMYSVPITYEERIGETKIQSIKDGMRILRMFFKNLFWQPSPKLKRKLERIMLLTEL